MTSRLSGAPVAFLYVTDRERALAFYQGALGLELRSADAFGDFLELGGGALARMTVMPDHKPGPHPTLGWNVEDMDAAVAALAAAGVKLIVYQGMGQDDRGVWTSPDGSTNVAWFADPDGNVLSLSKA